ncbi:putative histone deacetylase [Helianthus anomalus]
MFKKLMKCSEGKIVMALGGYNFNSLANSVVACIEVLLDDKPIAEFVKVHEELSAFWPVLVDKSPEELDSLDNCHDFYFLSRGKIKLGPLPPRKVIRRRRTRFRGQRSKIKLNIMFPTRI